MLDKIKKTGKNTAIYGIGNVLNKSLGLLLIPFVQSYLPINEYGWLTLLELIVLALSSTIILGITNGHERFFYTEKESKTYGSFLFSNASTLFLGSAIILLLISFFAGTISEIIFKTDELQYAVLLTLFITFFEVNNIIPFHILQYEEKATLYITTNSIRLLISLAASIFLLSQYHLGIIAVLYGRLIGSGLFSIYQLLFTVLPRLTFKYSFSKVKMSISYGFPLIISGMGYIIFSMSDRFMLSQFSTPDDTGKYSFGFKIANIVMIIVQSIGVGYLPSFYQQEKAQNNARYYRKMLSYYTFSMSYLIVAFLFFFKEGLNPIITNMDYREGFEVVPILSFGFLLMGMNYFVNAGIVLKNKTKLILIPTFTAAILNIILIYNTIPLFGFYAPAFSTVISQAVYVSIIAFISQKLMDIKFEWNKVFLSLFVAIIFFIGGYYIQFNSVFLMISVRIILLLLYPLVLYKLNFFEPIEIESIKNLALKFTRRK